MAKQSIPDIIEINGVKYKKLEEKPKPKYLRNIIASYFIPYDGDDPDVMERISNSVDDLVGEIARNWLPDPIEDQCDEYTNAWNNGWNSFRKQLIDTLGGV